jgi:hypothetical protein
MGGLGSEHGVDEVPLLERRLGLRGHVERFVAEREGLGRDVGERLLAGVVEPAAAVLKRLVGPLQVTRSAKSQWPLLADARDVR